MTIETEFEIGEEVYYIFKDKDGVVINKGTVQEILINRYNKIVYYVSGHYDELESQQLIHGDTTNDVIGASIKVLLKDG